MMTMLQTLGQVAQRSAAIAAEDPHGLIVSTVSVVAVFLSLLILFLAYALIGKLVQMAERRGQAHEADKQDVAEGQTAAERNVITIRRKPGTVIRASVVLPAVGRADAGTDGGVCRDGAPAVGRCAPGDGIVVSPLPGVISSLDVSAGDRVEAGDGLAVLEAMKMENVIEAEYSGTVAEIYVSKGNSVLEGAPLMRIQ